MWVQVGLEFWWKGTLFSLIAALFHSGVKTNPHLRALEDFTLLHFTYFSNRFPPYVALEEYFYYLDESSCSNMFSFTSRPIRSLVSKSFTIYEKVPNHVSLLCVFLQIMCIICIYASLCNYEYIFLNLKCGCIPVALLSGENILTKNELSTLKLLNVIL